MNFDKIKNNILKTKAIKIIFTVFIFIFITIILVYLRTETFYYISPYINKKNIKNISPSINKISKSVYKTCKENDLKIVYINSYGSNFVKNNYIPNNLAIEINIDIGEYKFNGENTHDIASEINNSINNFRLNLYNELADNKNSFFIDKSINEFLKNKDNNIDLIEKQINNLNKRIELITSENNEKKYFLIKENDIYISDIPLILYSNYTSGYKMRRFFRDIFIPIDYTLTLLNTKNNEKKQVTIVPIAVDNYKAKIDIRYFAPCIFSGKNSKFFLKNNKELNSKNYIETRFISFYEHFESLYGFHYFGNYLKVLKRFYQLLYIANPLLNEREKNEIDKIITQNFTSKSIILLNDYKTLFGNACEIAGNSNLRELISYDTLYEQHLSVLKEVTNEINASSFFTQEHKEELIKAFKTLNEEIKRVYQDENSIKNIYDFHKLQQNKFGIINHISYSHIQNYEKIISYSKKFHNILHNLGYYEFNIVVINDNTIGIFEEEIPKNKKSSDLLKILRQNGLTDYNLKIIKDKNKEKQYNYLSRRIWLRFDLTEKEKFNYEYIQKLLLKDKQNYNIKKIKVFIR